MLAGIHDHFWGVQDTTEAEKGHLACSGALNRTLHGSQDTPGKLVFVILFHGANPRRDSDQIISTKSNLDLLTT